MNKETDDFLRQKQSISLLLRCLFKSSMN